MKSKVLASVAALMAVGATCAFAANPFVDVPTDSWAYKSVVELALFRVATFRISRANATLPVTKLLKW